MSARGSVPSAEEFLRQLILFIDSRGSELLSRKAAFKLQPRALECVAQRLEGLRQLQRVKTSNPIRFLAGAVADLTDFLRMEKVQNFCALVHYLKLYSAAQDIRDPTPVNFSPFKSLTTLEIRGCDLSSVCPVGVEAVRSTVECIVCQDSLECLWHLLEPTRLTDRDVETAQLLWPRLTKLSCVYNDLKVVDTSLRLATQLDVADFSRNAILRAENLGQLTELAALDMSFNRLRDLGEIPQCTGLRRLFLQSNGIASLDGIQALVRLEELDLRWNVLSCLAEVAKLKTLSSLSRLSLAGNPICASGSYRLHVLACLIDWRPDVTLDARTSTEPEKKRARQFIVSPDGSVEVNPAESVATSVPTPSGLREFFSPFIRPFRRHQRRDSSVASETGQTPVADDVPEQRLPRPVKRIVDLPDTTFDGRIDGRSESGEGRIVTRSHQARRGSRSVDFAQMNGSCGDGRVGAVGLA